MSVGLVTPDVNRFLEFALSLSVEAGEIMRSARERRSISVTEKAGFELVTDIDLRIDALCRARIAAAFADHGIWSEEVAWTSDAGNGCVWIIDPIDGTANFANGLPHVCVSIALAIDGEVQMGVVHAPFYGETFWAVKGDGACCNNRVISVSDIREPRRALIATGFPHERQEMGALVDRLKPMLMEFGDIRRLAAPALDICWVADGRLHGFADRIHYWDVAAAGLIASEAGAVVHLVRLAQDQQGSDYLISAPGIFDALNLALGCAPTA